VAMIGLPPGLPWVTIEATLRAAAPGPPSGKHDDLSSPRHSVGPA
jgi:hypothetical protein